MFHAVWGFFTQGLGTDEETLIEIVCSRNNEELAEIKTVYRDSESRFRNLKILNKYITEVFMS